ncbi:MAG: endolytic transglycosylase MltG [bacterium]
MKKGKIWISLFIIIIVICAYNFKQQIYVPIQRENKVLYVVKPGDNYRKIAVKLQQEKLIHNSTVFLLYVKLSGISTHLKAGEYEITPKMSAADITKLLASGRTTSEVVVIPEGKWIFEIPGIIGINSPTAAADFADEVKNVAKWRKKVSFPIEGDSLEGYLFPDTYMMNKKFTSDELITAMLKQFEKKCYKEYKDNPPADGRSLHDVVTLASLVEGEAKLPEERPIIAGVYINRMAEKQRLECDATILYALNQRLTRVVRPRDYDSSYNTYRVFGLPKGPINNPGLASFEAALAPKKVPYFFYMAKGDGSHIFSVTYNEHLKAIRSVRGN